MATVLMRGKLRAAEGITDKLMDAGDVEYSYTDSNGDTQKTSVQAYLDTFEGSSGGGEVTVGSTIAGFTVGDKYLTSNVVKDSIDYSTAPGVYIGTDGILVGHYLAGQNYYPGVKIENSTGKLTANNVEITGGKIYNKHTYTDATTNLDYYMTAPDTLNLGNPLYMTDDKSEFSYVSTNGIGTMKFTSLDGAGNANCAVSNSYMSAGKLYSNNAEITGGTLAGFTLGDGKLYTGSKNMLSWTTLGGTYIGTDGIAIGHSMTAKDGSYWYPGVVINASTGKLIANNVEITGGTVSTTTLHGTTAVNQGGTGRATHTSNAILTGNSTSAVNNVATANGAFYATTSGGAAKFGTLPVAQGGTGSTTAAGGAINLLKELTHVTYSAAKNVTIPRSSLQNDGTNTRGTTTNTIDGLILYINAPETNFKATAKNDPSTGKATYYVSYLKQETAIPLPDEDGISTTIQILYIPYGTILPAT